MVDQSSAYMDIHSQIGGILGRVLTDSPSLFGQLQQMDLELGEWATRIGSPHSRQFEIARRELVVASFCAAGGLYRQAYSSLRLFLELSFASVYFSVHEIERRQWHEGLYKYSWSAGLDKDKGLLSKQFVQLFQPTLVEDAGKYASYASDAYRTCSEYMHGRALFSQRLPLDVKHDQQALEEWHESCVKAVEAVLFMLLIRYYEEHKKDSAIIDIAQSRFGHVQGIRNLIGFARSL